MRIATNRNVAGENYPATLVRQLAHPSHVGSRFIETIAQVNDFVLTYDKLVEAPGEF